jgi:uncharacterized protein YdhG (YjbR/CyaY superfamily)
MKTNPAEPKDIDEYIASFPSDVQDILKKIRATVREAAPEAKETIKYKMPTFTLNGNLVHFAAFKNHIGFYPAPTGVAELKDEIAPYEGAKSALRFPLDQPIPYDLIRKVVKLRVEKALTKSSAKRAPRY